MRSYSVNQADKQDDSGELLSDILFIVGVLVVFGALIAVFIK